MTIREEFQRAGDFLFRWRSYLPVPLIGLSLIPLRGFEYPFNSHRLDCLWEICCFCISFLGLGIRIFVRGYVPRGTSGRHTKRQVADVLNTTGMYSVVRHPLYLGNFLIWLGISLFARLWWFSLICVLIFYLLYERIIFVEEEFLRERFGDVFLKWAEKTPAFMPQFRNWRSPILPFSWRNTIRREYAGFFGIIVTFAFLELAGDLFAEGKLELDLMWIVIFIVGLSIYLSLRLLTKKKLLNNGTPGA